MRSDDLDQLIDHALSGYTAAEPPLGLEARVLDRVRVRKSWGWWWVFALPALASLVLAVLWRTPEPEPPKIALTPVIAPAVLRVQPPALVRKAVRRPARALPKQDQFPSPSPITPEERALMAFVAQHPAEARRLFDELNVRTEIQIEPLQSDGSR